MKSLLKGFWKKSWTVWNIVLVAAFVFLMSSVYWYFNTQKAVSSHLSKKEKVYEIVSPVLSESFSTVKIIGRVHSNQYAMVHPRREGVLKDILVDVGDEVEMGQTLALLFPQGVEGQSLSQIAKTKAELVAAQEELSNAQAVASESVSVAEKNLSQAQTTLKTTFEGGSRSDRSTLEQDYDHAENIGTQVMQNIQRVLFGDTLSTRSASGIVGNFSNSIQENKVYTLFQSLSQFEKQFLSSGISTRQAQLVNYLDQFNQLLDEMEVLYRTASSSRVHSESQIDDHIKTIQQSQSQILSAKDRLERTLLSADQLHVSVETAQENLELTESQAQKNIDSARNNVEVARAAYSNELARSGHVRITAPFSGTITSRLADVGHMIHSSDALFEIEGVETSLSQIAPLEVQFGVAEEWFENINIGDFLTISAQGKSFPATITRKGESLDMKSRKATVHASFDDEIPFVHNTNVYVHLADSENPTFSLPSHSIKRRRNENFVWILDQADEPRHLKIEILAEDGEMSDVRSEHLFLQSKVIENPSVSLFRTSQPFEKIISNPKQDD